MNRIWCNTVRSLKKDAHALGNKDKGQAAAIEALWLEIVKEDKS